MAQIPNLVPVDDIEDADEGVARQSGVDKKWTMAQLKTFLGVPSVGITPYMGTVLDDANETDARATLGVTRATSGEAITGTSTTLTMSPSTTKEAIFTHAVPAGSPVPWPTDTAPAGWVECDGGSFNVVTYPNLALAYPSGILPDLRGEFIRGWDNGRGVDSGRTVYSSQEAEAQYQRIDKIRTRAGGVSFGERDVVLDDWSVDTLSGNSSGGGNEMNVSLHSITEGSQTTPTNISFMYIVRLA